MKIKRTREELENILLTINEIVKANEGKIDFDKIKEEFLSSNGSKFDMQITEEELEEIFRKYDLILFKGEYQKSLNISELNKNMYGDIRFLMYDEKTKVVDEKTKTIDVAKIKKELKPKFVDELKKSNPEYSEEDINELYEKTFDEQYTRFQNVQTYKATMSSYINRLVVRENNGNLAKYEIKQKIKEEIQSKLSLEKNKLSIGLEKMLECFDSVFDIIWDDYYSSDYTKKILEEQEGSKTKDLFSIIKETMENIPKEYLNEHLKKEKEKDKKKLKYIEIINGQPNFNTEDTYSKNERRKKPKALKFEQEIKVIPVNRKPNKIDIDSYIAKLRREEDEKGEVK